MEAVLNSKQIKQELKLIQIRNYPIVWILRLLLSKKL